MTQHSEQRTVLILNDSLGIQAFKALADSIKQQTKDKILLARLDRLTTVFDYRTGLAVHALDTDSTWTRREREVPLAKFKKPEFFIEAAQLILTEAREANRVKAELDAAKRAARAPAQPRQRQRSWGWGY